MNNRFYLITRDDEFELPCALLSSRAECAKWLGCSCKMVYELVVSSGSYKGYRVEVVFI